MKWTRTKKMEMGPPTGEAKKQGAIGSGTIHFRQSFGISRGNVGPIKFEAEMSGSPEGEMKIFISFEENEHMHAGEVEGYQRSFIEDAMRAHLLDGGSKNKHECFMELLPWERVQQDWDKSNICPHCGHEAESGTEGGSCMYEDGSCTVVLDCDHPYYVLSPKEEEEKEQ